MVTENVGELLGDHVLLELEGIDRLYLNLYQPLLQTPGGVVSFFKKHRGNRVVSSLLMGPMSSTFVSAMKRFAGVNGVEWVRFEKGQRKDDVARDRLKDFDQEEGVLFVGVAQERFSTFRTLKRRDPVSGASFPWLYRSSVMCNQYYVYIVDEDFGPMFIKFSSYFPYTGRVCLNGQEYAKRQLEKEGIGYEALDNGFLSCEDPERLQQILDDMSQAKIEKVVRKWLSQLPSPFTAEDRAAGFTYTISILQSEYALTQVFDRPLSGRHFFEEVIRENLDIGRPEQVSLIFDRRVTKRTPGTFRTRVITEGVIPSLHVSYKSSKIKQYYKEGRALRTETTINNSRDFDIGRLLKNLSALREIGFSANRRLLDVQRLSHDCMVGETVFESVTRPIEVEGQRGAALKFGDSRVMALFSAISMFCHLPEGFSNRTLRDHVAALMGQDPSTYRQGRMTYDLRRLRLHGLIEKVPKSNRYTVTAKGIRVALFFSKAYARLLRPGLSQMMRPTPLPKQLPLAKAMRRVEALIHRMVQETQFASN
jgi:hypothetical protein